MKRLPRRLLLFVNALRTAKDPRWQVLAHFIRLLLRAHVRSAFYFAHALAHDALPAADPASSRSLSARPSCLQSTSGSLSGKKEVDKEF